MTRRFSLSALALLLAPTAAAQQILYVDANLNTGLNDGSSWDDAFQGASGLKAALAAAVATDRIFVAQGTYRAAPGSARSLSFVPKNDVEVYGSFLGTESSPAERPPFGTAPSILDGDLAGDDAMGMFGDNTYHLLKGGGTDASAVIDGFVVRGGNSNGGGNNDRGGGLLCINDSSPTIRNCHFVENQCTFGGGAVYVNDSAPTFLSCTFEDNDGGSFGGAFDIANAGAVRFDRCVFRGNQATRAGALEIFATNGVVVSNSVFEANRAIGATGGGAFWMGSGGLTEIVGCTIVGNEAPNATVGGILLGSSTANVTNTILWDNEGQGGAQNSANQVSGSVNVTYSIVEGGFTGTGNLSADPQFVDVAGGDYRLTVGSPAVDAGENAAIPADAPFDIAPSPRAVDEPSVADTGPGTAPIVDMGAWEFAIGITDTDCVPLANSTGETSTVSATGSLVLADNDVTLTAHSLPVNQFGYFLMSESAATIPVASGILCLGNPQFRFSKDVLQASAGGTMSFSPDFGNLPQGQVFSVGETWLFQLWHRDGATSNFSSSLGFTWL